LNSQQIRSHRPGLAFLGLLALGTSLVRPGGAEPEPGLILSLTFEEGKQGKSLAEGDRVQDGSGRNHHGVVRGDPEWVQGGFGWGVRLQEGDYLEVPASSDLENLTALSVEGWFHPEEVETDYRTLIEKWDHPDRRTFLLYSKPPGVVEWGVGWSPEQYLIARDGGPFTPNEWNYLVGTWNGADGALRLYRNGELVKEEKTPTGITLLNSPVPVVIGTQNNNPGSQCNFTGTVSRVRVWNRALTAEEVRATYQREKGAYAGPMSVTTTRRVAHVDVGSEKQLFIDDALIEQMEGAKLTVNRPELTGETCLIAEKPWEAGEVHPFGVTVMDDEGLGKMYYPAYDAQGRLWFCVATSADGIHWERPELGLVPFAGEARTNIVYPDESCPPLGEGAYFFGTCVFKDTNPKCPPEERYKMINGDSPTWVFASPDGLRFKPRYDHPSFRSSDTNNVCFFDERIGRYVAYMRVYAPWRKVVRCEFDDLSDFGPGRIVFSYDREDQARIDKNRFEVMDFYNSSAIKYPYAANAYFMFPSAYYHFPEPPVGKLSNDGITDLHFATSRDGIRWTRLDREPFIPLQEGQNGLYMACGFLRRGDQLSLYYGVYLPTHGQGLDPRNYISRAVLRLDGFVSVDAPDQGSLTTVPLTFSGSRLELNVVGEEVRVALLDEQSRPLAGFALQDCDPISGDHLARTVTWRGQSDLRQFAGQKVRLQFEMRKAKLYAFQFALP
jgi:hypothetical protein